MPENYSNEKRFEDIKKFTSEIKTRVDEIEENETLLRKNFEDNINLFVRKFIGVLHNMGIIETSDFYALSWEMRKDINDLINGTFGIKYVFKNDNPEPYGKDKK